MKLKIAAIIFHTLLVLSSAVPVEENTDYRNKEHKLRKQRSLRTDLVIEDSHFASEDLSELEHTINEQVTQNSDSIAAFHVEFSNDGKRLTQLENMQTGTPESTTPSVSTSQCGGRLSGESGVISYKEYETYDDEESCTWIIEVPEALKIGFKLEKTGLERCCDLVNVSSLDTAGVVQQAPVALRSTRTVLVDGPKAMVRFSSDESVAGLGFRLIYYKITNLNSPIEETINESECGGVIVGETGEISYKLYGRYMNNERCIWLIHSPNSTSITFNLQDSGFERCCDFVTVTTIDPETGTLRNDTRRLSENDVTIQESTAAIVFTSDRSDRGTGFFLKFSGSGVNTNPKFVYKLLHIGESNAMTGYPASESNDDDITKQQHIYVTAKSATGDRESSQRFISRIDMNKAVFLGTNDSSCVYDSLTLYEPLVINKDKDSARVWQKKVQAQIPNENNALLCPERFSGPNQEDFLDSDFHSFLAIYKPSSNDILESNTAVRFDYYYKPHQCVEILQPLEDEFGIISYKENYKNEENCSWIIEVTNATRIEFTLEQSGFEDCCDYVAVTSLDMDGQTQGATLMLRADSPTASVTGSRALVNFISDRNIVGYGFRLRYGSGITSDENVCGGVLNPMLGDFGVISYKANENYANGENCEWRIEAPEWGGIGFTLEQSGFEYCCDYVTISSDSPANLSALGQPVRLTYDNRNASITGSTALVRFTSDFSISGTGFRLRYEKLPALEHQDGQGDDRVGNPGFT
ncbi:unnamed protein product [Orchesella dallaii]|uniref:CUB domain-containing protein n=1 Tax=Orchesella dallaii TaxID=48710 RepID=A0ABP1RK65_9HEXA